MRLKFLQLPTEERLLYFEQAAQRRQLSPILLEKDFWVCWMLGVLFRSEFREALVFKGGTSLSKVFGVIQRFSEDIDLSLAPSLLGMSEDDLDSLSRNQADKWMKMAEAACVEVVQDRVLPEIENLVAAFLGDRGMPWLEPGVDPVTRSPFLHFHYPTLQPAGFEYLRRSVKLEFGSLTDQQPVGKHAVIPWLREEIPGALDDWACDVVALDAGRTFWEKATILHSEFHRPEGKLTPDRFSRHYADTAALAVHPVAAMAIARGDLRDRVVEWKTMFFGSGWSRYDLARPGTFRIVPSSARIPGLRQDYQAMKDMYFSEPVEFDQIIATLSDLEVRING